MALAILFVYVKPTAGNSIFYPLLFAWIIGWSYLFTSTWRKTGFALFLIVFLSSIYLVLHIPYIQNRVVSTVATRLSNNLKASVSIRYINYSFFDKMEMKGLLVKDQQKDTLLYAGAAKVNLTDWFFFKEKATLKYVSLDDAIINMHRTDSVWNYQFLADYFASPKKKSTTKKGGIEFDLKILQLLRVKINQVDQWKGHNLTIGINKLDLFADDINLSAKKIKLNTLTLDAPLFAQYDYPGLRIKPTKPKDTTHLLPKPTYQWNEAGWSISVKNIDITNGIFSSDVQTHRGLVPNLFDGAHVKFSAINGKLRNVFFEKDTLTTAIDFSTLERSGFEVKQLQTNFKFTPELMELKDLTLVTNKSKLTNYYAMHFTDFGNDMGDFIHRVKVDGDFKNSELNSDDISFFAPEVKTWKRIFFLNGRAQGTVDNLSAKKISIKTNRSVLEGNFTLKGLPDIDHTFIDVKADNLQTNIADIASIVPSLKTVHQPNLSRLGNISYKGNFTGFLNDFVAFGTIKTNLGTLTGDVNMKLQDNKAAVYLGKISTGGFNLGAFINVPALGTIVFDGKLNGSGVTAKSVKANFDGHIRSINFSGYNYQNISIKGDFAKNLFSGLAAINDPNLQGTNLAGTINFSGVQPIFKFDATLVKADLKKLKLIGDDFILNGHFNLNFTGSNIDNFLGEAKMYNAGLVHNNEPLQFDSLILKSSFLNGAKQLTLQSNNIDVAVNGQFNINELPDAFKVFLSRYYPAYIKQPDGVVKNQDFSFSIQTKEVDGYVQLLDKKLRGFNNSSIEGAIKLKENQLNVKASFPEFSYDGRVFNNIRLDSKGNLDTLVATIAVDDVLINDSLHLPATNLSLNSHNNLTDISITTSASKTLSGAAINAQVLTLKDGVKIHFSPSSFIINDKKWQLEKDGELLLSHAQVSASQVKFVQDDQEINISTEPSGISNSNDIIISLNKIRLDDLMPLVLKNPKLAGQLTGTIKVTDPFGKAFIDFDTQTTGFGMDGDSIGQVSATGNFDVASGIAKFKVGTNNNENVFSIEGTYNTKDSVGNQADIALVSNKLDLKILNNYLNGIFTDIRGIANTSDLKITGNAKHLSITGTANITEGSLLVNYTQCRYKFKNETVIFNPDEIDFGAITLLDTLNNTATLSGKMYHQFFNNIGFDNIKLETNKMLVLNTSKKDNSAFYGKVVGKALLTLNGSTENITMNITGEPSRTDSSHIYLMSGNSVESGVVDYIDFIQFGTKMDTYYKGRSSSNVVVNMALTANPSCKIDVILDESTGDIIKGEGNGLLKIRVGNKEPLTINGRYEISKGEYTFNFQTFLKKYFTVNSGSISWNGDPLKAQIDIVAEYLASSVDFSSIAGNINTTTNARSFNQKSDVKVLAHLTETLLKPAIDFEFELPETSPLRTDFLITKRLQQFKEDKNDLNKQVTSLLLFNTFVNNNQGFLTANSGYNVLSSTIGGVVSNAISGVFNKLLKKYFKNTTAYLDLNTTMGLSGSADLQNNVSQLQAAGKTGLTVKFLNQRLVISGGVNLDYNNPYINYNKNNNVLITPDVTAEFLITKDGRVRVVAFNRTNYDLIGQRNKTGFNLSYRKDFDKLFQLFTPVKEKPVKEKIVKEKIVKEKTTAIVPAP